MVLLGSFLGYVFSSETGLALCQVISSCSVGHVEAFGIDATSVEGAAGAGD